MDKLTPKQKAFCDYYIITMNATEAAIKAGYSKKTAKVIGSENLSKPYLKQYIDERMKEIEDKRIASIKEVMELSIQNNKSSCLGKTATILRFSNFFL